MILCQLAPIQHCDADFLSQILPIFPVMLVGTNASILAASQPPHQSIPMIIAGTTFQTLGMFIAVFMFSNYMGRLMSNGLPNPSTRPGMFISVGPGSFTGLAYIGMAEAAIEVFPHTFVVGTADVPTGQILKVMATFVAISFWSLSFFFFCLSAVAVSVEIGKTSFHMTWWSLVFPNTGFIIALISIGKAIDSPVILWTASVATVCQIILWLSVAFATIRAVMKRQILWPGKDEDADP